MLHLISMKLEMSNYTIWQSQVLLAARAHRLDQILTKTHKIISINNLHLIQIMINE